MLSVCVWGVGLSKGLFIKGDISFLSTLWEAKCSPSLPAPESFSLMSFPFCLHFFPLTLCSPPNCLGSCLPWCCPCPCSQQSPLLTGDLMEHRSHTAGYVHTDVSPLVLFCPAPSDMDLYCLPDVALRVAAPLQFWVLCCHPPPPHFTSITCSFCIVQ